MTYTNRKKLKKVFLMIGVAAVVISVLIPYLWMVSGSFKSTLEIQSADIMKEELSPRWIPREPTFDNYMKVNKTVRMLDYMKNSLIISGGTMFFSVVISLFAAYALSRINFRLKRLYELSLFSTQMFPGIAFLIPYFILFSKVYKLTGIPMKDTYWGMIFTYTSFALPFSILMLRNFLDSIPISLDEQAQIDGCNRRQAIFRVLFPVITPGVTAVAIYSFIMAWNEILFASILTGRHTKTVSLGLMEYITTQQSRWGGMLAACILVSVPVVIFFTILQKQIIDGLVQGATKG
ncbi:MAG: carbohydrate ABC transporter permease [Spirochaetales bacterium]|uniref:Carbohydrate ABC transporter permease n=1 Tax=Candidatus Thalassospirochaeta sargassi TaxID=3119039 RepID=A0AAJ1IIB5_9SPIO|nr:carbohydrate ABC transporter permease [Spirochaetales bacterium]